MQGFTVNIESGAGVLSQFRDDDFAASGAKIVSKTDAFKQVITVCLWLPSFLLICRVAVEDHFNADSDSISTSRVRFWCGSEVMKNVMKTNAH